MWVPDERHEAMRDLSRARQATKKDSQGKRQQISSLMLGALKAPARVYDDAGPACVLRYRRRAVLHLPRGTEPSAPRNPVFTPRCQYRLRISPVNASTVCPRGASAHHSGPMWLATPSP